MASIRKVAFGAALVGGLAAMCTGPKVPPHLERIEYLEQHLSAKTIGVRSNFFREAIFVFDDGRGYAGGVSTETTHGTLYTMLQRSNGEKPLDYYLLSARDTELHGNDGDVDQIVLIRYKGESGEEWVCKLWRHEVPDRGLLKRLDLHYELSTEAAYLALTEGEDSYRTVVGENEWDKLSELCGHSE